MNGDRIFSDETGLEFVDETTGESHWQLIWTEVDEIVAWKEDRGMYDTICIGFRVFESTEYLCCNEEQQGWNSLLSTLDRKFSIHAVDWWRRVAFPPFETNWTVVWRR